jgi:transcription elongation factor Elf1
MATIKQFECEACGAEGKISVKGTDYDYRDVVCCPVCGGSIVEEDDDLMSFDE